MELGSCRDVDEFEKLNRIGEGTYGTVYRARDKLSGHIVALKRVILHNESQDGFPLTALREIKLLQRATHVNCVKLLDVVVGHTRDSVFLVFEYCEHDLSVLLDSLKQPFSESEVKRILYQLLSAISHLHDQHIIHRDLKMSNLLYNRHGQLRVADFGLSRELGSHLHKLTPTVVTLWYRAPELLLGSKEYTNAIDMWAIGCIFAELVLHEPLMPGRTELDQLDLMIDLLGMPTTSIWPSLHQLPAYESLRPSSCNVYNRTSQRLPSLSQAALNLLNGLLTYDPRQRLSASDAMRHPYFTERPFPKDESMMPTFPSKHDRCPVK